MKIPKQLVAIEKATAALNFNISSDRLTGQLLRGLAASKINGQLLELGTGTGLATAWMLDGMSQNSTLITMDNDPKVLAVAQQYLGEDKRLTIVESDGAAFVESIKNQQFDLIFADTWAGKITHLEEVLGMVKKGGFYVIDDMTSQPNWVNFPGHAEKIKTLIQILNNKTDFIWTTLEWSTGLIFGVKQ